MVAFRVSMKRTRRGVLRNHAFCVCGFEINLLGKATYGEICRLLGRKLHGCSHEEAFYQFLKNYCRSRLTVEDGSDEYVEVLAEETDGRSDSSSVASPPRVRQRAAPLDDELEFFDEEEFAADNHLPEPVDDAPFDQLLDQVRHQREPDEIELAPALANQEEHR